MKKTQPPKLTLSRETLIELDTDDLQAPRGGQVWPTGTCRAVCTG